MYEFCEFTSESAFYNNDKRLLIKGTKSIAYGSLSKNFEKKINNNGD